MAYNWDSSTITLQDKIDELNGKIQDEIIIDLTARRNFDTEDIYEAEVQQVTHQIGDVFFIIDE